MINILTEQNVGRSLAEITDKDILISPELGDYSAADFDNLVKTVPIGEAAARKVADRLRALSLPPQQYAEVRSRQSAPAAVTALVIDAIKVEGIRDVSDAVVLQAMQTRIGQPLDTRHDRSRHAADLTGAVTLRRSITRFAKSKASRRWSCSSRRSRSGTM